MVGISPQLEGQTCNQRVDTFTSRLQLHKLMQHECVACRTCQLHHRENKVSDSVVFPLRSAAVDCVGARCCWRGGEDQRKMCGK